MLYHIFFKTFHWKWKKGSFGKLSVFFFYKACTKNRIKRWGPIRVYYHIKTVCQKCFNPPNPEMGNKNKSKVVNSQFYIQ